MADLRPEIRHVDMPQAMQERAIQVAKEALQKRVKNNEIGAYIRDRFDTEYGPAWHCVVGKSFGGSVAYEEQHIIYFKLQNKAFMLYKWG
ncbi:unnamed protein product [Dicrocoelium dendriticum]|nr:unnamed protein product [Dicrocoelium dendriticum]